MNFTYVTLGLFIINLFLIATRPVPAAELITLSKDNFKEYAPKGKESDAIFGDYVLRNDKIIVTISDPSLQGGRSSDRRGGIRMHGCIIDLTLRHKQNDLIKAYEPPILFWPKHVNGLFAVDKRIEANTQAGFINEAHAHASPGRQSQKSKRVRLSIPYVLKGGTASVVYILEDGWPYLEIHTIYKNIKKPNLIFPSTGILKMTPSPVKPESYMEVGYNTQLNLAWVYDVWFGQAYGITSKEWNITPSKGSRHRSGYLAYTFNSKESPKNNISKGEARVIIQQIFPAENLFNILTIAGNLHKKKMRPVTVEVIDNNGTVSKAYVQVFNEKNLTGAGFTDRQGNISFSMGEGQMRLQIDHLGSRQKEVIFNPKVQSQLIIKIDNAGGIQSIIRDERNKPLPCKMEIRGRNKTPDPFFFPDTGDHLVQNLIYSSTGTFKQRLPPGDYDLIISRGSEYDVVFKSISIPQGKWQTIEATLIHSVKTTGWISADFGNRSTVSRNFSLASQKGRVLNLACEQVEFAPSTEHDTISEFAPHIKSLKLQPFLASCPGIYLTRKNRKSYTMQNAFPVIYKNGRQAGGAVQRPKHIFQVFWLNSWYGTLVGRGEPNWVAGSEKLIQVTPPGLWSERGGHMGMLSQFGLQNKHELIQRNSRLAQFRSYHAMEIQPLASFLNMPHFDPQDPKGIKDIEQWRTNLMAQHLIGRKTKKWPKASSLGRHWIRMLNLGYRFTGVVNSNAYYNYHGSGGVRNYIKSKSEHPSELDPVEIIRTVKKGHVVMSTGLFLEVNATTGNRNISAGPGDDMLAIDQTIKLRVKIQSPNWIGVNKVQVLFNGFPVPEYVFERNLHPDQFLKGVVKFNQTIELQLKQDTHIIVIASGQGMNLRGEGKRLRNGKFDMTKKTLNPFKETSLKMAMSNPIYVDIDGDGFRPQSPLKDKMYGIMAINTPLLSAGEAKPAEIELRLKNLSKIKSKDTLQVYVYPKNSVQFLDGNGIKYILKPNEIKSFKFKLKWTGTSKPKFIVLHIPRSSRGIGRREIALKIFIDEQNFNTKRMARLKHESRLARGDSAPVNQWWLPEHCWDKQTHPKYKEYKLKK
ncbi:hypothetical protein JYT61_00040 [bacterium AH-315-E10]|nr:hypothetical protein [bacterium AH-315-E10]